MKALISEYLPLNFLGAPLLPGIGRLTAPASGGTFIVGEFGVELGVKVNESEGVGVVMCDGSKDGVLGVAVDGGEMS